MDTAEAGCTSFRPNEHMIHIFLLAQFSTTPTSQKIRERIYVNENFSSQNLCVRFAFLAQRPGDKYIRSRDTSFSQKRQHDVKELILMAEALGFCDGNHLSCMFFIG